MRSSCLPATGILPQNDTNAAAIFPTHFGKISQRIRNSGSGMDHLSQEARSANMSRVRSSDTGPELKVRRLAHSMGLRFRLKRRDLPGTPDLVFPRYRLALFVHGCFWHRHAGCARSTVPKTRVSFWTKKFEKNIMRDKRVLQDLEELGWHVLIIWECELKDENRIRNQIREATQVIS